MYVSMTHLCLSAKRKAAMFQRNPLIALTSVLLRVSNSLILFLFLNSSSDLFTTMKSIMSFKGN